MIKLLELLSFAVSVAAFGYGAFYLFRKDISKYFKLYACAAGCYMLEELWVIVNSLLGNGSQDGLVTVRLIGFFGCLCFMLSANMNVLDKMGDEGQCKNAKVTALIAPTLLLLLYGFYALSPVNSDSVPVILIGFISISPALLASYFSLKYLLLSEDKGGLLTITKGINMVALIFYAANYVYPLCDLYCSKTVMSLYDLILSVMMFVMILLCRRGVSKWKTLN